MKSLITSSLCLTFFLFAQLAIGQNTTERWLRGRVLDGENNEALIGTAIQYGQNGVTTDPEGRFTIKLDGSADTLKFSMLGYEHKPLAVAELPETDFLTVLLTPKTEILDEIVVSRGIGTAYSRRRNENLQEIPEAISIFSSLDLEEAQIEDPQRLLNATPGVSMISSQNIGTIFITVRGITQVRNGQAPVTTVVDGVTLISPNSINAELFDIESVEIMKGPQGALYGRNAIGGAISIITKKPGNELEGFLRSGIGNGEQIKMSGGLSGAIVENKLRFRVAGSYQDRAGLIENATTGEFVDPFEDLNLRAQLFFNPNERTNIDAKVSYTKSEGGAVYWVTHEDNTANDFSGVPENDLRGVTRRELLDGSVKAEFDFGRFGTLESVTAYSKVFEVFSGDLDFTSASLLKQYQRLENIGISEEIRLTSPNNKQVRWILGAYALAAQRDLTTIGSVDLASPLAPVFGFDPGTGFAPFLNRDEANNNTTLAAFGQLNVNPSEALELTLALRYDNDRREQENVGTGQVRKASFNQFQPKLSVAYQVSERAMLYATYATGFRSGGFNAPGIETFPALYQAEVTENIELGLKTNFWDNRLTFNTSLYHIDFQNQQVFTLDIATLAQGILNVDRTRILGAEAELKLRPTDQLDISGGFSFTDGEITEYRADESVVGNVSPFTSRTMFNGAITYRLKVGKDLTITPHMDVSYHGKLYWHVDNQDFQEGYTLTNFNLGIRYKNWSLTGFMLNAFDTDYAVEFYAKEYSGGSADLRWPNPPRRFGASLEYRF